MCPEIAEKLACKQYKILSVDIQKIMDEVFKKHGNAPISFLNALERKMLSATNWNDNGWVTSGATSTEKYILFLIGEIFIQIQWLWHLIPTQGNQASRTDALAIYTGNVAVKNRRKRGEKEHPIGLPRDVQYYWRTKILLHNFPYLNRLTLP